MPIALGLTGLLIVAASSAVSIFVFRPDSSRYALDKPVTGFAFTSDFTVTPTHTGIAKLFHDQTTTALVALFGSALQVAGLILEATS
jgi:hypothetical protein